MKNKYGRVTVMDAVNLGGGILKNLSQFEVLNSNMITCELTIIVPFSSEKFAKEFSDKLEKAREDFELHAQILLTKKETIIITD